MPSEYLLLDKEKEITMLREEIRELKRCQINYFAISVTGTGAILGFASAKLGTFSLLASLALLAPLAIILPCWMIFFDKAHTITRVVGYIKILERNIGGSRKDSFIGFENALAIYRKNESFLWKEIEKKETEGKKIEDEQEMRYRYRFWKLNWWTFFVLSFLCIAFYVCSVLYSGELKHLPLFVTAVAFIAILSASLCAYRTMEVSISLIKGKFSYEACTKIWELIFSDSKLR